jgi:hypothetical protein
MNDTADCTRAGPPSRPPRIAAMVSLCVLLASILFVPARIGSQGYFPPDDAPRHVGKAISGKPWNEILVMRKDITTDMHHGWDLLLGFLHKRTGMGKDGLLAFSYSFCFILFMLVPLFFLRRPEAWLVVMGFCTLFDPVFSNRFLLGRPFIIGCAVLCYLLLTWRNFTGPRVPLTAMVVLTAVIAVTAWLAPTAAYLFGIPLLGFALARQWTVLIRLTICIAAGSMAGYALTGYPMLLLKNVSYMLFSGPDQTIFPRMLVTEFQPAGGDLVVMISVVIALVWRFLRKKWTREIITDPLFFNAVCGAFLGLLVCRFWADWGRIAAVLWLAREVDEVLAERFSFNALKRLGFCAVTALCFFITISANVRDRWTYMVPRYPLIYEKAADEEKKWFPDSGGIFYNDKMNVFYQTFFENPRAPWRYVLGFEPILMENDDLRIYRAIQRSGGSISSYQAWVDKMTPADRMLLVMEGNQKPVISTLEWRCLNLNTWVGRLPKKDGVSSKTAAVRQ